jgi:glycosyltransferase involved in cell wall biosynthesis
MTPSLRVLVLSTVFPGPAQPVHGRFVYERIRHAATRCDVRVVAPIPWFVRQRERTTAAELTVDYPRFFYAPGVLKWLDGVWLFLSVLTCVRRIRRTFDFDVIDAHFAFPEGMAAVLLGRWFSRPVVVTLRGAEITLVTFRWRRAMIRWTLRRVDRVIAVSHQLAELAKDFGAAPDRVEVIENGVDAVRFSPGDQGAARRGLGLDDGGRWIVTVGRLVPGKGFHVLVRAVRRLLADFPDLRLAIVGGDGAGSGGYPQRLRSLCRELGISERVLMAGARPAEEIPAWLNAADVFVLSSEREGSPNVVWEALACGRPVVATRVGQVDRMVPPFAGVLVTDVHDPEALRCGLDQVMRRTWDSAAIRAHAMAHTWDRVAVRVVDQWIQSARSRALPFRKVSSKDVTLRSQP